MNESTEGNSVQDAEDESVVDENSAADAAETDGETRDPLEELRAEVARWQDIALRSQADLDNYRKRMAREKAEAIKFSNASLLEDLLPVLDNFHRGLAAARGEESSTIFQGMTMVMKQIEDFLKEQGVEPIDTTGADFDPNIHEAVSHEFSDSIAEGKVIQELRPGFKLRDRLLRASNIIVSKGPRGEASSEGKEEEPEA